MHENIVMNTHTVVETRSAILNPLTNVINEKYQEIAIIVEIDMNFPIWICLKRIK